MKVDNKLVDQVAHLARLEFNEEEKEQIIKDLSNILGFVEQLNEVDTTGVEPLVYMTDEINVIREDEVKQDITHAEALLNAPKKDSDYFRVRKVIEQ